MTGEAKEWGRWIFEIFEFFVWLSQFWLLIQWWGKSIRSSFSQLLFEFVDLVKEGGMGGIFDGVYGFIFENW